MTPIFIDTYYLLALVNPSDESHDRAVEISQRPSGPLVTTAWILTEFGDALAATFAGRTRFLHILDDLYADPVVTIVDATQNLFTRGITLYRKRPDKEWSLTDCTSFVVMKEHKIKEALTGDRHFEQAGFQALMK
jgi:predicted nucleic acid-binding protein